jgi:hypothetical protein
MITSGPSPITCRDCTSLAKKRGDVVFIRIPALLGKRVCGKKSGIVMLKAL